MRNRIIGSAAVLALLLATGASRAAVSVGDTPAFEVSALDGSSLTLAQYRGKVIVVDFWATWCGPCMGEAEHMVSVNSQFKDKGVQFIGISLDENEAALRAIIKEKNFNWPQFFDGGGWGNQIAKEWGVQSIPATFIIDPEGKVAWKGHAALLDAALAKVMKNTPPSAIDPAIARAVKMQLDEIDNVLARTPETAFEILAQIPPDASKVEDLNKRVLKARQALLKFGQSRIETADKLIAAKQFESAAA